MIGLTPGSFNAFAKLDGITGDSTSTRHPGEIDVDALRFCVAKVPGSRAVLGEVVLGKVVDSATPQLITATETGRPLQSARIVVEKPGSDTSTEVYRIDLSGNVHVVDTVVNTEPHGIGEEVTLTAGRLQVTFTQPDGRQVVSCFDFGQQRAC
jgi:type VI protein secretion system component Hcp